MKRFLLSFLLLFCSYLGFSQVVLNEVYSQPNLPGHQEFFELYNSSISNLPVNLDCYQLITYDATGNGSFYVLDLPNMSVNAKSYFVGAATSPFSTQGNSSNPNQNLVPNFSWSSSASLGASGSLKKYTLNASKTGYTVTDITSGLSDFFVVNTGNGTNTGVFLFNNGAYINGFMGGVGSTSVPADVRSMPQMQIATNCGTYNITWSAVTLAERVGSNAGTDNGFARTSDGSCGTWVKTSSSVTHTPGRTNGSAAGLTGSLTTANVYNCSTTANGTSSVTVNVTGASGDANATNTLPIEVQLYYDNKTAGTIGQLDGYDVYQSSKTFTSFTQGAQTFIIPAADRGQPVIITFKTTMGCFDKIVALDASCITLPVTYTSFNAVRRNKNVELKWETASEENNKGFYVQRNTGGEWKDVAFVFSAAANGNSSTNLAYAYNDPNSLKGVSQYRILQVDIDGKGKYSEIRSVRGEEQAAKVVVFPNPSADKLNVLFEDALSVRDIKVMDIAGRMVRQYLNVTSNSITIDNLRDGFYNIQVTDRHTGVSTVEKAVIKKR